MEQLGKQLLIELHGCSEEELNNQVIISHALLGCAEILGVTVLKSYFHRFSPQGITGIVVIAESHLSIHTWPEHEYAAVDIFSCGKTDKLDVVVDYLVDKLKPVEHSVQEIVRGAYCL